ncbi:MAG: GIY-YIG nuclease family protein [bacterium]
MVSNYTSTTLYCGSTVDLDSRIRQHRSGEGSKFSAKYNCKYLLYYEEYDTLEEALLREKRVKRWNREWKMRLIKSINPDLEDLWEKEWL